MEANVIFGFPSYLTRNHATKPSQQASTWHCSFTLTTLAPHHGTLGKTARSSRRRRPQGTGHTVGERSYSTARHRQTPGSRGVHSQARRQYHKITTAWPELPPRAGQSPSVLRGLVGKCSTISERQAISCKTTWPWSEIQIYGWKKKKEESSF